MVAATIRTIFIQPNADAVYHPLDQVADMLGHQFPKVKQMLLDAKEDLTAFVGFPALKRLVTAVLSEMHDEWIAFPRRYLSEGSMAAVYAGESAGNTTHELPNTPNTTSRLIAYAIKRDTIHLD